MTSWFRSVTNFMRAGHAGGSSEDEHSHSQSHQDDAPIPAPTDSRVHRGTLQPKDRTGSVLDIPPPPAPEHMEPMFETFISEMGLKPDKAETLRMLPREHKWRLLYQHYMVSVTKKVEQGTGESKETPDYQCKLIKSEPTAENLATLRVLLQSATVSWVTSFMELKGIPLLYDIIAGNADEEVKAGALKCLRAMMNFQEGLNAVLDHQQSFSIIVRSIRVFQNEILGELSLEHLMVGCRLSPDHYFQVLDAFTTASRGEPRFMCIISSLTRILSLTYRVSCIAFINTIISEAPSEGERREIRNELLQTGLGSALQVVEEDLERRNSEEVSAGDLLTQIGVFKDLWDMDKTLEEQQNQFTIFTQRLLGTKAYKSFEGVINRWMKMPYDQLETEIEFVMNGVVGATFGQLKKAQEETKQAKAEIQQLQSKLSTLLQSTEGTASATTSAPQPGPPELPSAPKPVGKMGARGGRAGHLPSRTPPPPPPGGAGATTPAAEPTTPKSDSDHTQASQLESSVSESKTDANTETKPKEVEEAPKKPPVKETQEAPQVAEAPVKESAVAEAPKVEVKPQTVVETPAPVVVAPPPPPPPPPGMMGGPPPPPPPPPGMMGGPPPPPPPPPGMMGGPPPPPPPPPGMMGGPPPPPGMMAAPARTAKYVGKPKNAMKPLHWTKIPPISVDKTIWRGLSDHNVVLEVETLDAQFRSKATTAAPVVSPQRESSKKMLVSLLDSKRSNNANIVIQHIKLDAKTIKESLILMQDGLLSEENIKGLIDICPTEEELRTLTSYEGSVDTLGKAEQFLMEMISIPYLTLRLNAYYFRLTAPTKISELRKSVDTITKGCAETKNSKQFSRILEIVLAIGNFMNGGTNRGNCFGFKLSYISELAKIKSVDNKTTLLSFIASLIFKDLIDTNQYPNSPLNQLSKQLLHIPLASKITLGQLQSDVSTLQKQVEEMKSQVEKLKEGKLPQDSNARFISRMEEALRDISTQMKDLAESYADMVVAMRNFLLFIGEDADSEEKVIASTEEHFALLAKFMEEWDQACRPIEAQYQPSGKEKKPVNSPQPEKRKVLPQKQAVPAGSEGRLMDSLLVDLKDGNYFKNRIRMQQQRTNS